MNWRIAAVVVLFLGAGCAQSTAVPTLPSVIPDPPFDVPDGLTLLRYEYDDPSQVLGEPLGNLHQWYYKVSIPEPETVGGRIADATIEAGWMLVPAGPEGPGTQSEFNRGDNSMLISFWEGQGGDLMVDVWSSTAGEEE